MRHWLESTSNRTFVVWPIVLLLAEALWRQGVPSVEPLGLPLLAWGYLQYRWAGSFRKREGGGGPGMEIPPDRIVERGPYRWVRNPMYLGHLIFFAGLAIALESWLGAALFAAHVVWFQVRVREDERRLAALFGDAYGDYRRRVKRWIPGLL